MKDRITTKRKQIIEAGEEVNFHSFILLFFYSFILLFFYSFILLFFYSFILLFFYSFILLFFYDFFYVEFYFFIYFIYFYFNAISPLLPSFFYSSNILWLLILVEQIRGISPLFPFSLLSSLYLLFFFFFFFFCPTGLCLDSQTANILPLPNTRSPPPSLLLPLSLLLIPFPSLQASDVPTLINGLSDISEQVISEYIYISICFIKNNNNIYISVIKNNNNIGA